MRTFNEKNNFKCYGDLTVNKLTIMSLICFVFVYYLGVIITERNLMFDDSFISYRYAKNLAYGYGITWNPNEQPVEGYTNFLLVLILAPFIKFGLSPLLVTRILSFTAVLGISLLLYKITKENYNVEGCSALFIPAIFLLSPHTSFLCMVGLETVIYTAVLFFSFTQGCKYLDTKQQHYVYLFGLFAFVAFLLRPEAVLLVVSFVIITTVADWKRTIYLKSILLPLRAVTVSFVLPLLAYMVWKYLYFGTVIPNSFFIKAVTSEIFPPRGVASVLNFMGSYSSLIIAGLFSFTITKDKYWQGALACIFSLFYVLFYVQVDTLMDIRGRFMYPISIFLVFLSIPTFILVSRHLLSLKWHGLFKIPFVCALFLLFLNPSSVRQTLSNFKNIIRSEEKYTHSSFGQKYYRVAMALKKYQNIKRMRMAFDDAGIIPYFSDVLHLDVCGLNDRFIARERDISQLTDYFFDQRPDLIMHPANKDHSWVCYSHGPLGNHSQWSHDKRWDRYYYIGTIKTHGNIYDIHLLLRRDMPEFERFKSFLQKNVADGYYNVFPISIGSYIPSMSIQPIWIPISSGAK